MKMELTRFRVKKDKFLNCRMNEVLLNSVQREEGAHVTELKHEIDLLHIKFSKECLDLDYKAQNISPQVTMISAIVRKAIDEGKSFNSKVSSKSNFPTIFKMICSEPWFSCIRKGIKPVEGRKNTPKHQKIHVGDFIDFSNEKETFLARVVEIKLYASLEDYLKDVTFQKALPGISSFEEAINIYHQWSTPEEIRKYGFLGIFIKPLDVAVC